MATQQQSQREPVKASRAADILAYVILFAFIAVIVFVGVYRITRHIVWDEPLIPTPLPTFTPTPTPAPTPTALPDDTLSWVSFYADAGKGDDVDFRSAEEAIIDGENILVIKFYLNPMYKEKYYRVAAARAIINVGQSIRSNNLHRDYDSINFLFYGGFIDKYGNKTESLGIRAWYEDYEFDLLNFDYFNGILFSDPDAIIKAADDYIIHTAYRD